MVSRIFFIFGIGGAGKSTLVNNIKGRFLNAHVHDFDEAGVPKIVTKIWRHEATNYWLGKAREYYNSGEDMYFVDFYYQTK